MTDLTTLSTLLGSQEARDAAPCVPPSGAAILLRDGTLICNDRIGGWVLGSDHVSTGHASHSRQPHPRDIIWSGDLPVLLAALVAERDGLAAKLARARLALSGLADVIDKNIKKDDGPNRLIHDGVAYEGPHIDAVFRILQGLEQAARVTLQALKEQQP